MKSFTKMIKILAYFLLMGILGLIFYFYRHEIFMTFKNIKGWYIGILIFLHIPTIALGGLAFQILCTRFKIYLRWMDWFGLSFIANFLNQLLPYRPGMIFRFLYLHQRYQMKGCAYITVMLVYLLLTLGISGVFTLFGWTILRNLPHQFNMLVIFSLLGICFIIILLFWLPSKKSLHHGLSLQSTRFPLYFFKRMLEALRTLLTNPMILLKSLAALACMNILTAIIFYLIFLAINAQVPILHCLFIVGVVTIAMVFPITPGNIGILETLIGMITQLIYNNFSLGFSVVALYRTTQWIPSLVIGSLASFILGGSIIPSFKTFSFGMNKRVD